MSTKELQDGSHGKEIHFSFWSHNPENVDAPQRLQEKLFNLLSQNSHGTAVYVMENPGVPANISNFVYTHTRDGMLPSRAISAAFFAMDYKRYPTSPEEFFEYYQRFPTDPFAKRELEQLDATAKTFPSRMRILLERMPRVLLDQFYILYHQTDKIDQALKTATGGNFKEAFQRFKTGVTARAQLSHMREDEIARQISKVIDDPSVIGIVVGIGASHSPLHYRYRFRGKTHAYFDHQEIGIFVFPPVDALTRKIRLFPERHIPNLEWHQALIGQVYLSEIGFRFRQSVLPYVTLFR